MNFTRNIFRNAHIGDFFLKNQNILDITSVIIYQKKTLAFQTKTNKQCLSGRRCLSNELIKEHGLNLNKRLLKKKKFICEHTGYQVIAYSTAEEYNLENLLDGLPRFTEFEPTTFGSECGKSVDVIHAVKNSLSNKESQDVFFFREGSVVMWNMTDSEVKKILSFLKKYEDSGFIEELVASESELMNYIYSDVSKSHISKDSLVLSPNSNILLEKFAISNAMALSVHLGAYEASLEQYITTMEPVTEDLKAGVKIKMSRNEVLRKTGQLFALRHNINLNSDLLDTPDFYWDRGDLESLYQKIFNYYCITKRTKVINEKLNHCIELVDLLSSHLNDRHHVRLEWMIIMLIMVEVGFEFVHYLDRYLESTGK